MFSGRICKRGTSGRGRLIKRVSDGARGSYEIRTDDPEQVVGGEFGFVSLD